MPKCYLHGETAQPKKTTPLKTHPGFPENSITQGLALALVPKPQVRDLEIKPYRYWEFENYINEIKELKKSLKDLKEEVKKSEEKFLEELEENKFNYQLLIQEKNKEITELNNKLNQLITRILNISEKPTGTFDPELKKQKGIKELLEKYSVDSLEELVVLIDKAVEESEPAEINQELKDFLDSYSATNLRQVAQTWQNTEEDYLARIESLLRTKSTKEEFPRSITFEMASDWRGYGALIVKNYLVDEQEVGLIEFEKEEELNKYPTILKAGKQIILKYKDLNQTDEITEDIEEMDDEVIRTLKFKGDFVLEEGNDEDIEELIAERDQLRRDKGELQAEVLDYNNKLKLKQQEVGRKETEIERLKKEKSQSEISLNKKITEWKEKYNKEVRQLEKRDEEIERKLNDGKDWSKISLDFKQKGEWTYKRNWVATGFTYNQCKEWIDIGMGVHDQEFCAWLRDEKELAPEQVLNHENRERLRKEWKK